MPDTPEINVEVVMPPVTEPVIAPVVEPAPVVVVVSDDDNEVESLRAYKAEREEQDRLESEQRLAQAESTANYALDIALNTPVEPVVEPEPEPEIVMPVEPDVVPTREHGFWRTHE